MAEREQVAMYVFDDDFDEGWVEPLGGSSQARAPSTGWVSGPVPTPPQSRSVTEAQTVAERHQPRPTTTTQRSTQRRSTYTGNANSGGGRGRVSGAGQLVRRLRLAVRGWHESVFRAAHSSGGVTLIVATFVVTSASPARGAAEGVGGVASSSATGVGRVVQSLLGLLPDWPVLDELVALEAPAVIPAVVAAVAVGLAALRRPRSVPKPVKQPGGSFPSSPFLGGPR